MTPLSLENKFLRKLGLDYLGSLEYLAIVVFFYGVFVVLFFTSAIIFARKGFSNRATAAMFVATAINFLLSTLNVGIHPARFVLFVRNALILNIDRPGPLLEKRELIYNSIQKMVVVGFWAQNLPVLLSDLIVIWRAWALFPDQRWVILIPFVLWIGAVGMNVGEQIWTSDPHHYHQAKSKTLDSALTTASFVLSIATNAVTTMMIAYKLWIYRTFIVTTLGLSRRKRPVQTILILLVESGLFYLGFQIVYLVLTAYMAFTLKAYAFEAIYLSLAAMYPTVVMLLVESQRSITDVCEISASNTSKLAGPVVREAYPATLGHLSFAVGPVNSSTDNDTVFRRSHALQRQGGQKHGLEEAILEVKE